MVYKIEALDLNALLAPVATSHGGFGETTVGLYRSIHSGLFGVFQSIVGVHSRPLAQYLMRTSTQIDLVKYLIAGAADNGDKATLYSELA